MARWRIGARETLTSKGQQEGQVENYQAVVWTISPNDFSALFTEVICPLLKSETSILTQLAELPHSSRLSEDVKEPVTHSLISDISTVFTVR